MENILFLFLYFSIVRLFISLIFKNHFWNLNYAHWWRSCFHFPLSFKYFLEVTQSVIESYKWDRKIIRNSLLCRIIQDSNTVTIWNAIFYKEMDTTYQVHLNITLSENLLLKRGGVKGCVIQNSREKLFFRNSKTFTKYSWFLIGAKP